MHECCLSIEPRSIWLSATPDLSSPFGGFAVTEIGHFYANHDYYTIRDQRKEYLLLYTLSGEGTLHYNDKDFTLSHNCATLIDCNLWHHYKASLEGWEFLWIHLTGTATKGMYEAWELTQNGYVHIEETDTFERTFQQIMDNISKNSLATQSAISLDIHTLLHMLTFESHQDLSVTDPTKELILRTVHYMNEHYALPLSIETLAAYSTMSKYHFIRKFKQYMGITPYQYLLNYRINRSKILLRTTKLTILEISSYCGFLDDSNFIEHFHKQTHSTPSQYRKDFS